MMRICTLRNAWVLLLACALVFACSSEAQKQKDAMDAETEQWRNLLEDKEASLPLDVQAKALLDSIKRYEDQAFKSEELKLNGTQLLIEEVEQSLSRFDQGAINNIKRLHEAAKGNMYDKNSMANEQYMEQYDAKVDAMVEAIKVFRENTPEFEKHVRAKLIYEDIISSYNKDLFIRNNYNIAVSAYNKLLNQHGAALKKLGEQFRNAKPFPFFWGKDPVVPAS
jgi:hypothetical protein